MLLRNSYYKRKCEAMCKSDEVLRRDINLIELSIEHLEQMYKQGMPMLTKIAIRNLRTKKLAYTIELQERNAK